MDVVKLREYETLSPFEIKDFLAKAASKTAARLGGRLPERGPRQSELDRHRAARGVLPARAVRDHREQARARPAARRRRHAAGARHRGSAGRVAREARGHARRRVPRRARAVGRARSSSFDADAFVHELVDSIIGDNYPVPDRMLVHNEQIVHEYLQWAMCGSPRPKGRFELYAVEGGTAAMCYIFKSMKTNRLLNAGDTIALGTPIFTPYLEMPHLEDYDLKIVNVQATQENRFQFDDAELEEAARSEDQGVLRRQSRQSERGRAERGDDREDRRDPQEAAGPDPADRRRLRHVRAGLPLAARRVPAQHDRRLLLQQVLRLHRLAPRRDRRARGQPVRRR